MTTTKQIPIVPMSPIWRLSVEQYHTMIECGVLTEDDPVELLEGWLIPKMPKNAPHVMANELTRDALAALLPEGWFLNAQQPITLANSEPEPDITIVLGSRRDYPDRLPYAADIALVVEVSDATLQRDREWKRRLYAEARIVRYWILSLLDQHLEVYTAPEGEGDDARYAQRTIYRPDDSAPVVIGEREVGRLRVKSLLP
jgi:Uma2 family endonuclease